MEYPTLPQKREEYQEPMLRKPYHRPELRAYGSVRQLTQGTAITANGDGGQNMMA